MTRPRRSTDNPVSDGSGDQKDDRSWMVPISNDIRRRTVVSGAAWTVPVVMAAIAAPQAAASIAATTTFVSVPHAVAAGTPFGDIIIAATMDGTVPAPAGGAIVVTLPTGFAFSDGTTTPKQVIITSTDGTIVVTGITAAADTPIGTHLLIANYGSATATAPLTTVATGNVVAWGLNGSGQRGNGTTGGSPAPVRWLGDRTYTSLTGAYTSFAAIAADHTVWSTGNGANGTFGLGSLTGTTPNGPVGPALVATGKGEGAVGSTFSLAGRMAAGHGTHDEAIWIYGTDGNLYATGENSADQFSLNDGTTATQTNAAAAYTGYTRIGLRILAANPGTTIKQVDHAGNFRASYLLSDGTVWSSGANRVYAMGNNGVVNQQYLAAQALKADLTPLTGITQIAVTQDATMYLDSTGAIWGSGYNNHGQLPGTTTNSYSRTAVPLTQPAGKTVTRIWGSGADRDTYVVRTSDGLLYAVGANESGQASTGRNSASANVWTQVIVPSGKTVSDIEFGNNGALYLMTDGTVYFAGYNDTGGNGVTAAWTYTTTMSQVPIDGVAFAIAATWYDSYAALVVA